MISRRKLLRKSLKAMLFGLVTTLAVPWGRILNSWAQTKEILPKGFPRSRIATMDPASIDNRNLEIDALDQFGTMGSTEFIFDPATYRLKVTGDVSRPLSLRYDEILELPSVTANVLLVCLGFFANNGRWTGVDLGHLVKQAQPRKDAVFVDIKGQGREVRVRMDDLSKKKIFLAYLVNGQPLPQKHGFPLRLVYEGAYGMDWIKYVDEVVVSRVTQADS